ncbi:hypothetical protein ZWY2020_011222 [Hordeum vulgare]|nr:hypothetical protein ZWY2020_011222 [Hordeum vulgare]
MGARNATMCFVLILVLFANHGFAGGGRRDEEAEAAWTKRRRTLVLVNLASVFEKADEALYAVPAVYQGVGAAVDVSPTMVGAPSAARSSRPSPFLLAAYASAGHDRAPVRYGVLLCSLRWSRFSSFPSQWISESRCRLQAN